MANTSSTILPPDPKQYAMECAFRQKEQAIKTWEALNLIAEPSYAEEHTAMYVDQKAQALGLEVLCLPNSYTRVVRVTGTGKGKFMGRLAYKVDLDALSYKQKDGSIVYRHGCFHSGHLSIAMATMENLCALRPFFNGEVIYIFQSAEEAVHSGANELIQSELFQSLQIDRVVAMHASPELLYSQIGIREGHAQAGIDVLTFQVVADRSANPSRHVARPQAGANPIWGAIKLAMQLRFAIAETADPVQEVLFNVVQIGSGNYGMDNVNVLPNECTVIVNFRFFDMAFRQIMEEKINLMTEAMEKEYGGRLHFKVTTQHGTRPVYNDPTLTGKIRDYGINLLGSDAVLDVPVRMGGDDLGLYSQLLPATMIRLGTGNPAKGIVTDLHNEHFTVDTECFVTGISMMTYVVLREMGM